MIIQLFDKILDSWFKFKFRNEPKIKIHIYKKDGKWCKEYPIGYFAQNNSILEHSTAIYFTDYLNTKNYPTENAQAWDNYKSHRLALELINLHKE